MRRDEKQGDRPSAMLFLLGGGGFAPCFPVGAQEGGWGVSIHFMRLKLLREEG